MDRPISEDRFDELLATYERSAFRLETRSTYALGYESADFERFLAGSPVPPPELDWWRPWLERIKRFTAEGRIMSRVRVLDEPPSDYQCWELWAAPWHSQAGERISYMSRSRAQAIQMPMHYDWWLLDDERLIIMDFTDDGEVRAKILTTEPGSVARHRTWRDLAVRNATPAGVIAAA